MISVLVLVHMPDEMIEVRGRGDDLAHLLRPYPATADHVEAYEPTEIIWDPAHVVAALEAWQRSSGYV